MSGDYSRQRFSPVRDFSSVLMQQGRVQLDSDWNEQADIHDRNNRASTLDTLGRAVVPSETKDAFLISLLTPPVIHPGRIYVDGILVENHGVQPEPKQPIGPFDPVLAEPAPGAPLPYNKQPYYLGNTPDEPRFPTTGTHLVYLDVWQREITSVHDPSIIEEAVGHDTTTRRQTAWQVRTLEIANPAGITCFSKDADIPGWPELIAPSAGRLTTSTVQGPQDDDPCLTAPGADYRGLENRLYRFEIHDGGDLGKATVKWSRDNASVASAVTDFPKDNQAIVWSTGKDDTLRFHEGDWVEITDDLHEFDRKPGIMAQIDDIDDASRTITFKADLPAEIISPQPESVNTRMIRWDQHGQVRDADGNPIVDLDAPAKGGVIPLQGVSKTIEIEHGILVRFELDGTTGTFHTGDYWTAAARTASASFETLTKAPPRGIHHHFARLALVTLPSTVIDCRTIWPPTFGGTGCECDICIDPEEGGAAIQRAIDEHRDEGATICLGAGVFNLGNHPIVIGKARRLRIRGKPRRTELFYDGPGSMITLDLTESITLENLTLHWSGGGERVGPAIDAHNCADLEIHHCDIWQVEEGLNLRIPAIGLSDHIDTASIHHNRIRADIGIANLSPLRLDGGAEPNRGAWNSGNQLLTTSLRIEHNELTCRYRGVSFARSTFHRGKTVISRNIVRGACLAGGLIDLGSHLRELSVLTITENHLEVEGNALLIGFPQTRIERNTVATVGSAKAHGIIAFADIAQFDSAFQIIGNRIAGCSGAAIFIVGDHGDLMIKQNMIERTGSGIQMENRSSARVASIENNHLLDMTWAEWLQFTGPSAIRTVECDRLNITGNVVDGFTSVQPPRGIWITGSSVAASVTNNQVSELARTEGSDYHTQGIACYGLFDKLSVRGNQVRRPTAEQDRGSHFSLFIERVNEESDWTKWPGVHLLDFEKQVIALAGTKLRLLNPLSQTVAAEGNQLEADTAGRTALVETNGACAFSNNQCTVEELRDGLDLRTGVSIRAAMITANGNLIDFAKMALEPPDDDPRRIIALANNTRGITWLGGPLPPPWIALNHQ